MPAILQVARPRDPSVRGIAIAISAAGLLLAASATASSIAWIGRTFPGFVVIPSRLIAAINLPHWTGANLPDVYLKQVIAMDGRTVSSQRELERGVAKLAPGTVLRFELSDGGGLRTISTIAQRFTAYDWTMLFGAYLFNGAVFLASGLLAWVLRPGSSLTRAFLAFSANSALFLFTAMDLYGPGRFLHFHLLAEALLPATLFQLLLLFPQQHRFAPWRFLGYPVALLLFLLLEITVERPQPFVAVFRIGLLLAAVAGILLGMRGVLEFLRASSALARQRVRVATVATLAGFLVPALIFLTSLLLGRGLGMNTIAFAFFAFPIGLAYAIAKHDFLAIDAFVKRGAYYLVLTGAVGVVYALGVFVLDRTLRDTGFAQSPVFGLLFTIAVLVLFNPLRTRLQGIIDRTFFRSRFDSAKILAEVGNRLASALHPEEIVRLVCTAIDEVMQNAGTRVLLDPEGSGQLREIGDSATMPPALRRALAADRIVTSEDPVDAYLDSAERDRVLGALAELGGSIAVPMHLRGKLLGAITVGAKHSGLFFTGGDAEFLRALAQQAAIAVGNANATQALMRVNLDQLELARRTAVAPVVLPRRFELLGRIGQGGMGIVLKARHVVLETVVAVKVLPETFAQSPELVRRFHREARVMAQLRHPNIVRVLDIESEGTVHFFVMEYVEGASLEEILRNEGRLSLARVIDIGSQIGAALACAHAHEPPVVHRDITPSNVLVEKGSGRIVVTDFGIAKVAEPRDGLTMTGEFFGKPWYSAPEQIWGKHDVDGRADIYSLGVVMHEMLTGRNIFAGMSRQQVLRRVALDAKDVSLDFGSLAPDSVRAIIARAITMDRERRYRSVRELLDDLDQLREALGSKQSGVESGWFAKASNQDAPSPSQAREEAAPSGAGPALTTVAQGSVGKRLDPSGRP